MFSPIHSIRKSEHDYFFFVSVVTVYGEHCTVKMSSGSDRNSDKKCARVKEKRKKRIKKIKTKSNTNTHGEKIEDKRTKWSK